MNGSSSRGSRAVRRMYAQADHALLSELPAADVGDTLASIRPLLERVRRGEWRLLVTGPRSAQERDLAATFSARLLDLADTLGGRT